ncbi:unnamed protein product, partial [Ectocarpus sp. 12 AP-2014]
MVRCRSQRPGPRGAARSVKQLPPRSIPPELGKLAALQWVSLRNNQLT